MLSKEKCEPGSENNNRVLAVCARIHATLAQIHHSQTPAEQRLGGAICFAATGLVAGEMTGFMLAHANAKPGGADVALGIREAEEILLFNFRAGVRKGMDGALINMAQSEGAGRA